MRIAMIGCKGIPAASALGGGIETHVEELATRLVARGHEVTVYVRPYANPEKKTSFRGVQLVTLPTLRSKHLDAITHTLFASLHVVTQKVDVVHYHGVGPSTLAWIPRLFKWGSRVVVTFHARDRFHEKWSWFAQSYPAFGEWTAVTFPHATIAVSHIIQLFVQRMYGANGVTYIPNGVEIVKKTPGTEFLKANGLESGNYFFTLSRITQGKAIDDAIKAFAGLATDKKLVVIGAPGVQDIQYFQELKRLAATDGRIIFVGRKTGVELHQLMAHSYAMIHPSRHEGLSVAILEAMSYAKLVVMSDIPENRELVDHSGIAYKVGNIKELTETLQWLVNDAELVKDRGARAQTSIQKLYSWESVVLRTEQLYFSLFPTP